MRRVVFAVLFLLCSMSVAFGQATVTYGGFATMQGPAVPPAAGWPPLVVTPQAHLQTMMSSPIGISNEGRAGISIEGRATSLDPQPSAVTVPVITNPGVYVLPGLAATSAPEEAQSEERENEGGRTFEFGVGNARAMTRNGVMTMPLGSSIRGKGQPSQPSVRTYTNDDMRRVHAQGHISVVGRQR